MEEERLNSLRLSMSAKATKILTDRKNWLGAAFLNVVNEIVLRYKFRQIEVIGRNNLPDHEPFILVSNHGSRFDGLMVQRALKRKANYMVSPNELKGLQGFTLPWVGAFPANPRLDITGFALETLKKGEGLVVFPEGNVFYDGQIHPFKFGAARIALKAYQNGMPLKVVPAAIDYEWGPIAKARIVFGEPVEMDEYVKRYQSDPSGVMKNLSDSLHREVLALKSELFGHEKDKYISADRPVRNWAKSLPMDALKETSSLPEVRLQARV